MPVCTITDLKYGRSQDKAVQYSIITLLGGGRGGEGRTAYVTPGLRLTRQPADRKQRTVRYCHNVADCVVVTATIVLSVFLLYGYSKDITICVFVVMVTTMAVVSVLL